MEEFNTEKDFAMKAISELQKDAQVIQRPPFCNVIWPHKINLPGTWLGHQILNNISEDYKLQKSATSFFNHEII